ncbi:type I polyketide synthase [Candidatus Chloroploca sp. Khr17]|uniref:type I polyketide synthase n=1 Tax=Candidatus Chloroploca sp. Khr17 TaxID=2496869 RepID=UPI00101CBE24|nr:type I polyketide synthase [Candidatus Chloroploca sp. Khr17]
MSVNESATENLSPLKRAIIEIRALKERVAALEQSGREAIALVGMGLRFPGGCTTPDAFWSLLSEGGDAVGPIPADRWDLEQYYDADPEAPGKMTTRHGAFLEGIDQFAPHFFAIAPREASQMDPQQRLLLQVAWEALEHAGQAPDRLDGSATGVFVGLSNSDYMRMLANDPELLDVYLATGNSASIAAGRISYLLGLRGPSMAVDSACSSSLVAVHLAVRSLRSHECDLALAGGVNLILTPEINITFSKAGMLAPDGRCKTFDAAADGYVRGEGCAIVVLKRLSDALAAGDRVLAVIRGSAVNQDGRSSGLTAPNGPAQEAVIRAALADAGIAPSAVGYVEAHGTGTSLGDPIEVQALGSVFGAGRDPREELVIGSAKTNIGHLEAAAGVAGLIKAVLMLHHREFVPNLHFVTPSPHIRWDELPLRVPTMRQEWHTEGRRIAGVSSFGFSGTNAHVIIEEAPAPIAKPTTAPERPLHLMTIAAKSERALHELARRYAAHLAMHPEQHLADVAFSANCGRAQLEHRLAIVAPDSATMRERLEAFVGGAAEGLAVGHSPAGSAPEVVFLFTGHGSHYVGMGRSLDETQPVFRNALDRCDELLRSEIDRPLRDILFGDGTLLDSMRYAQPALFALQYALAELWQAWGVRPAVVAGHSAGEYVAAVVAGVLSLEDGLRLIAARGRLMQTLPAEGEMVAIFADEARVAQAVVPYADRVGIAAINGPETTVISGQRDAVRAVLAALEVTPDEYRKLDISIAAHSPLVEPILDAFERSAAEVRLSEPQIGLVSSLTGAMVDAAITSPRYWRRHLREPVRFATVFDTLYREGYRTFVEIGPHPTLLKLGQSGWPDASGVWVPSLHRDTEPWAQILGGLAALAVAGVQVDWRAFDRPYGRQTLSVPTYPWENDRYWAVATRATQRNHAVEPWPVIAAAALAQAEQGPLDLRVETYGERWALLDQLADAYIVRALRSLGLFTRAGETHTVAELVEHHRIVPTYERLLARWLDGLATAKLLRRENEERFVADGPLTEPPLGSLLATAATVFADTLPLLDYVCRCGERLAAVITGEESALTTLFPDGSYVTVDFLYHEWAVARYFNRIVRAVVLAAVHARPEGQLRVLEIGAGTGGTTADLLPVLPPERTSYTFTDVSDFFLARAAERFVAYPFVHYVRCDIEQPPGTQGLLAEGYDLIVASNVLHATRDLDATLRHVRSLLAPGGTLVLYEATSHPHWFDLTTALIEGWQRFEDDWRSDNPLLAADTWASALAAAGFAEVLALPGREQATAVLGQHVIIARNPGEARDVRTVVPLATSYGDTAVAAATPVLVGAELRAALEAALPDERHDLLVDLVRHAIARVLRIANPRSLQREQPLLDLGFDSLMAVELRNVLRQSLELPRKLPATLVFDYPTIAGIARYLDHLVTGDEAVQPSQPIPTPTAAAVSAEAIADLSDEEVEAMLLKRLAEFQGNQ